MPSTNSDVSTHVSAYISPQLKIRMERIRKSRPRLTVSFQIEQSLEAHLPVIEQKIGFKPKGPLPVPVK